MTATAGLKDLLGAIESQAFDRAYLFVGDDDFRKQEALSRLLAGAVDPATRDFNLEVRRGGDISAESLGSILATPPMMADRRVVVLRDAAALKKDAKTVAEQYLDAPADDVVLVLVQPAGEKPDPRFGKATTIYFESLVGTRLSKWISQRAENAFGSTITPAAVDLLIGSVGNDLSQLNVELEKLASYRQGGAIDDAAVADVVGIRREETMSALLDAVAERNAAKALGILSVLIDQPKSSGVSIVMVLAIQMLGIGFAHARLSSGTANGKVESELFAMLKDSGGGLIGRSWGEAVRAWTRYAPRWTNGELLAACATLHAADRALKDTGRTSEEGTVQNVILALCQSSARRVA